MNICRGNVIMEINIIAAFSMIVILNAMSPGANLALVIRSLSHSGSAQAYSNVVGFSFAWLLHGALLAFGISQVIASSENLFMSIKFLGATYLCWLGAKALISSWTGNKIFNAREQKASGKTYAVGCREGFITSFVNPQTFIFLLAVFPQFIMGKASNQHFMLIMILIFLSVSISWFCFIVWLFGSFRKLKENAMFTRCIGAISGMSLISIGVMFIFTAR